MSEQPSTALAIAPSAPSMPPITLAEVKTQIQLVEATIKTLMVPKLHYGSIPGCGDKPTLLKPGAEMLAKLFQLRPEYKRERIDMGNGHIQILTSCTIFSRVTGLAVGEGSGSCSTLESKYRWRKAAHTCPACGVDGTICRSKFAPKGAPAGTAPGWYCYTKKGGCGAEFAYDDPSIRDQKAGRVENPDIADQYNTVQKMADKRAYVAAVITSVGASDFVTQDIEDFADAPMDVPPRETTADVVDEQVPAATTTQPQRTGAEKPASVPSHNQTESDQSPDPEANILICQVMGVNTKSGISAKGKPYTIYVADLLTQDGKKTTAGTFDKTFLGQLDAAVKKQCEIALTWIPTPKGGKDIVDIKELPDNDGQTDLLKNEPLPF